MPKNSNPMKIKFTEKCQYEELKADICIKIIRMVKHKT